MLKVCLKDMYTVFAGDKAAPSHRPHPNFDISKRKKKKKEKKKNGQNKIIIIFSKTLFFLLQTDTKFIHILIIYRKFS